MVFQSRSTYPFTRYRSLPSVSWLLDVGESTSVRYDGDGDTTLFTRPMSQSRHPAPIPTDSVVLTMSSDGWSSDDSEKGSRTDRLNSWILLDGPRQGVAGIVAGGLFVFVLAVSTSRYSPLNELQPLYYVFGGLIGGNLTLITVVVSINQLLLSQELSTPTELRSEIDGMVDYRQDIEAAAGRIPPVEPLGFLRLLVETTRQRAQQVGGLSISEASEDASTDIDRVVTQITGHLDRIDGLLGERDVGTFQVLSATLNTNYTKEINRLRRIQSGHDTHLSEDVSETIDDLVGLLQDFDIARQYLKSIYLQQELASLSRLLFYTGLPAIAALTVTFFAFTTPGGTTVSSTSLPLFVSAVITIGLLPLTVLFSYILRTATVARRTAAVVPFTVPTQEG